MCWLSRLIEILNPTPVLTLEQAWLEACWTAWLEGELGPQDHDMIQITWIEAITPDN